MYYILSLSRGFLYIIEILNSPSLCQSIHDLSICFFPQVISRETVTLQPNERPNIDVTDTECLTAVSSPAPSIESDPITSANKKAPQDKPVDRAGRPKVNISKSGIQRVNSGGSGPRSETQFVKSRQIKELRQKTAESNQQHGVPRSASERSSAGKVGRGSVVKSDIKIGTNYATISQSSLERILDRPKPGKKSKLGYRPAHMSAPFKTEAPSARLKPQPAPGARYTSSARIPGTTKRTKQREKTDFRHKEPIKSYETKKLEKIENFEDVMEKTEVLPTAEWTADDVINSQNAEKDFQNNVAENREVSSGRNLTDGCILESKPEQKMLNILTEGYGIFNFSISVNSFIHLKTLKSSGSDKIIFGIKML